MVPHYKIVPTKPTPAMRRFLVKLTLGTGGRRTYGEMGFPAYPMRVAMERAGWLTCVYWRDSRKIFGGQLSQIWCSPKAFKITPAGRRVIAEKAELKPSDIQVLKFVRDFGPSVTFGGREANTAHREAAKRMLTAGYVTGSSYQCVREVTAKGLAALKRAEKVK